MVMAAEWRESSSLAGSVVDMKAATPRASQLRVLAIEDVRATLVRARLHVGWEGHQPPGQILRYMDLAEMWCVSDPTFFVKMSNADAVEQRLRDLWRELPREKDGRYWQGEVPAPDEMLELLKRLARI